jgi:hypothetical protein
VRSADLKTANSKQQKRIFTESALPFSFADFYAERNFNMVRNHHGTKPSKSDTDTESFTSHNTATGTGKNRHQMAALFIAYGHWEASKASNRDEHHRKTIARILETTDSPMLVARLDYAARGWWTFPAKSNGDKSSEKAAQYSNGVNWGSTKDERVIRGDFKKWPTQNIGIMCGVESGVIVIETDTAEHGVNGEAALKDWETEHGALPETLMACSPSGSIHRYFNHPGEGIKVKSFNAILGDGSGVDCKADGGMVIAPPSYRPQRNGKADGAYSWINPGHPIADAPQALLDIVIEKPVAESSPSQESDNPINKKAKNYERQGKKTSNSKRTQSWAETALDDECDKVASAAKGKRNHQLNASAFSLGQIVGAELLSEADVTDALLQAAKSSGLLHDDGEEKCTATINSGLSKGKLRPRTPPDNKPPDSTTETTPEAEAIGKAKATEAKKSKKKKSAGVTLNDFYALMTTHSYIFVPSRELWPASSVNTRIPSQPELKNGKPKLKKQPVRKDGKLVKKNGKTVMEKVEVLQPASVWLDQNHPVEQMTWAPGFNMIIEDRLISEGGWIKREGVATFNMYRPPSIKLGDAKKAERWIDLVKTVYPTDAEEIFNFCAHRRQKPEEKINHSLILGGKPGIGKDTILEALKQSVGPWNFREVSPQDVMGQWNDFMQSVALRISEVRDLGEINRFAFYEHCKTMCAAPPDVVRVNTKYIPQHYVINICGVIFTTNHKTSGIYLPADDRRTYVAWSDLTQHDFEEDFWIKFWHWYQHESGFEHVAAWLQGRDISKFDAKAPPVKTPAFWAIVGANVSTEDGELADIIDEISVTKYGEDGKAINAITLLIVTPYAEGDFQNWLLDRKNRRAIPHRFEACGFVPVRSDSDDGLWVIKGKRQVIYARAELSLKDQIKAARDLVKEES